MAFSSLVKAVDSKPFDHVTVRDYLWGYDDPIVKIAHMALPDWITFKRLGLLDRVRIKHPVK
jgi:scavenger receptor class B protein 1